MTTVTVVTPWFGAPELRENYWAAIEASPPDEVYIVENGVLGEYSVKMHAAVEGLRVRPHFSSRNLGFSRACNLGLHNAACDAVLFLNNDVVLQTAGWLEPIRAALRPGVLVGAQLRVDEHTKVDGRTIPYLDGWCLAGMTDDLLELGGWDEEYEEPSYYGDNDLCLRAKASGMKLVQVPVGLKHLGNYTSRQFDVSGVTQRNYLRYAGKARSLLAVSCP